MWSLHSFQELSSTQDSIKTVSGQTPYHVVTADIQVKGRGRHGRVWESVAGNLSFSFSYPVQDQAGLFSLRVGVAIARTLEGFGMNPLLKWPNDVLLDGQKVSGILIERDDDIFYVGIGLNIVEAPFDDVACLANYNVTVTPDILRDLILSEFEDLKTADILELWSRYSYKDGQAMSVKLGKTVFQGVFNGLDSDGSLRLAMNEGIKIITAGDVYVTHD